jgi:hypothetical protein
VDAVANLLDNLSLVGASHGQGRHQIFGSRVEHDKSIRKHNDRCEDGDSPKTRRSRAATLAPPPAGIHLGLGATAR